MSDPSFASNSHFIPPGTVFSFVNNTDESFRRPGSPLPYHDSDTVTSSDSDSNNNNHDKKKPKKKKKKAKSKGKTPGSIPSLRLIGDAGEVSTRWTNDETTAIMSTFGDTWKAHSPRDNATPIISLAVLRTQPWQIPHVNWAAMTEIPDPKTFHLWRLPAPIDDEASNTEFNKQVAYYWRVIRDVSAITRILFDHIH
jgi:hypothetical protein